MRRELFIDLPSLLLPVPKPSDDLLVTHVKNIDGVPASVNMLTHQFRKLE